MKEIIRTKHLEHTLTTLPTSLRTLVVLFAMLLNSSGAWADITGSGTEADPYVLSTVADWNTFAANVNAGTNADKYYKLSDSWDNSSSGITTTVGTSDHPFSGTFNGNGKTITANIDDTSTQGTAPFRWISGATIKNLTVDGYVNGGIHCAALVGFAADGTTNLIEGVTVSAAVTTSGTHCGGIMGHGKKSATTIKDCIFSGSITGGTHVGVLWGWSDSGCTPTIQNCLEKGTSYTGTNVNPVGLISTWGSVSNTYYLTAKKGSPSQNTTRGTKAYASASDIPSGAPYTEVTAADGQTYYVVDSPEGLSIDNDYIYGTAGFYYVNMPATGTNTVTLTNTSVTTFKVYDDGGKSGNYSNNCAGTLVLTAPGGYLLQLSGSTTTRWLSDKLTVYDNSEASGTKLLDEVRSTNDDGTQTAIPNVTSTGQSMTLYFKSDGSINYAGLDLTVTLVNANTTSDITVSNPAAGGSVEATVNSTSVSKAKVNDVVTLTATPSNGYLLSSLSVTDANSNAVTVTDMLWYANTNTATFTMPASAVNVTPTFTNTLTADGGLYINMPATGTKTVTIPSGVKSFKVYDDGGASGNYSNNCDGTLTLTAPEGYMLRLSGNITTEESNGNERLTVYDGSTTSGTKLLDQVSSTGEGTQTAIKTVNSTGQSMTLYFYSDGSDNYAGLDLTVTLTNTSTEYNINGIGETTGGSVAASVSGTNVTAAYANDVVTLTATPSDGYLLSNLSVVDGNSNAVAVAWDLWGNTATFTMPASAVTVTPTFINARTAADGLSINMPKTGTKTATIPSGVQSFKVYDDGGKSGNYSNYCDGTLTLTAPEGYVLQLSGTIMTFEISDYLTVYDNSTPSGTKLLDEVRTNHTQTAITTVTSTGQSMTLYFYSNYSDNHYGLDLTVTLVPITYTITYDLADGTVATENPTSYTVLHEDITLNNPTRDGYTFAGWTGTDLTEATANVTIAQGSTGNREYTATWTAIEYTITYNLDGGTVATENPTSYTILSEAITLNNPTRDGYTFAGWTGTDLDAATETVTIAQGSTGNRTYTATWTAIPYTITYDLADGSVATANPTTYTIESEAITLNNPTRNGYTFAGWTGTDLDAATMTVTIAQGSTGNREYTATWTKNILTLLDDDSNQPEGSKNADIINAASGDNKLYDVTFVRTFPAGKKQTVCLPFAPAALLSKGKIWQFSSIDVSTAKMTQVSDVSNMTANTPYIFEATTDVTSIVFTGVKVNKVDNPQTQPEGSSFFFKGTYAQKHWEATDDVVKNGTIYGFMQTANDGQEVGQFVKARRETYLRPFSCWLEYSGNLTDTDPSSHAAARGWVDNSLPDVINIIWLSGTGETTGVSSLDTRTGEIIDTDDAWYTLNGRRLSGKPSTMGLYIHKGKKVIIK